MKSVLSRRSLKLGSAALLALLLAWGTMLVRASADNWTDHADTDWYLNYADYTTFTIDSPPSWRESPSL
ncbi:hypothetical protein [Cohnella faecalis]|uniref:Uncharacterized protein n=1 Tax=Cohnella faecalis TaxID=2315694 RepID=A0A398CKP2_9BACL|nr:hypothetical protein [Cohnella faecalis]RIE02945.1 hypothetical protein D3H35_20275 [Cohnella faecalis]